MRAGDLRHRITIQTPAETSDTDAGLAANWTDVATVWASINPISGREYFTAQETASIVTHRVRMRYRTGIRPEMRLEFGQRYFRIDTIIDRDERRRELEIMCHEVVGDA